MPAIQVENLSRVFRIPRKNPGVAGAVKALFRPRYDAKVAVDSISFAVEPGEIVGYIGVNGAGKCTTIKMLTGILVPTGGQVRVLGCDARTRVALTDHRRGFARDRLPRLVVWLAPLCKYGFVIAGGARHLWLWRHFMNCFETWHSRKCGRQL